MVGNTAETEGGAIKFNGVAPIFYEDSNIFIKNKALYGPNIASYAVKINYFIGYSSKAINYLSN
jgi:hypothetical protein